MKKALVTGVTGQDGSYLAELLLEKGYFVVGGIRRSSTKNTSRINHLLENPRFKLEQLDLLDGPCINYIIKSNQFDEVYNLAAQSHVKVSFSVPEFTMDVNTIGCLRVLEAIRLHSPHTKYYFAATSEMFGKVQEIPQKETTPFYPRSPYGVAKLAGYWLTKNYRESYNLFTCSGILFNHESPRRGDNFVTQKIVKGIIDIKLGVTDCLYLGNLDAKRDWGHAKDYVEGMWLMLQQDKPDDFILATGETTTVRSFIYDVCEILNMPLKFRGKGLREVGYLGYENGEIRISKEFYRPCEVDLLIGDPTKAKKVLGWENKYSFTDLVAEMVLAEYSRRGLLK